MQQTRRRHPTSARELIKCKRCEEVVRQMEEYRNLFKLANDPILIVDVGDGVVLDINDKACETYGYSREEFIGRNLADITRDLTGTKERFKRLLTEADFREFEVAHFRADGSAIDFLINTSLVDYQGHRAVLSINREITERKRAEVEQKRLQGERDELLEQLQLQMEFMPVAFMLSDTDFRTIYWNPAAERIFGFTRQEVVGKYSHRLIVPAEAQPFFEQIFERIAAGETSVSSFSDNVTRDGRHIACEWYIAPLKKADGKIVGLMCMAQDVTDRKEAEQRLEEANSRALKDYERLVERIALLGQTLGNARDLTAIFRALRDFAVVSVPCDGMVISLYDAEKQTRRFVYCWADNREFDTSELVEVPVRDGLTGRAIKSGSVGIQNKFDLELSRCQTSVVIGECSEEKTPRSALSAPMTVMGRTIGCVELQSYKADAYRQEYVTAMRMAANLAATAVENVSLIEREHAKEEQLRQSQKMEAIGQLAGGVAHDFNNLLTVITGYCELSLRRLPEDDPVRINIEQISKAGTRAAGLTRQLLAFSRRQMLQAKVLDLNSVVKDMDQMLQRLIGEDMDLVTLLKPALGQIKADPGQIEQVLLNLVVNARDAMPEGGKITIETSNAYLDEAYARKHGSTQAGQYVVLTVSDTGRGMDEETQKRIFDPFFTTKEVGKGTGLGLSTVYGIVKQSQGNVWVYSEVGKGTTFKIYLPRVDEGPEEQTLGSGVMTLPAGSETVLLVEDDDLVRDLTMEMLKECGYAVMTASNGEEGLRVSREFQGRIDLMITDVVMPGMSGRELAEQIAVLRPESRVLYMSGYTDDAIVRHGILDEHVSFIQKPFSANLLLMKAREVLDQSVN